MPIPSTLPQWASDETNNTEPSSGQKESGWTPSQDGVSDYMNWWMYLVYLWIQWVSVRGDYETITGWHAADTDCARFSSLTAAWTWSAPGTIFAIVPISPGQKLATVHFVYNRTADDITFDCTRIGPTHASTGVATHTVSSGTGWTSYGLNCGNLEAAGGDAIYVAVTTDVGDAIFSHAYAEYAPL